MINSISPSGTIKLARHRKEQQVHTTTNRANQKKVLSQQAQEEVKELDAAQCKRLRNGKDNRRIMKQCQLTTIEEDEEGLDPYIPIEVGSDRLSLHALVDSGAHLNTMS